ncbi:hypothetical protein BH20VER1_BH20VER1_31190 [soil metagenome]
METDSPCDTNSLSAKRRVSIYRELHALRERVEDLEDSRDLEKAITENGDQPLVPWDEAKGSLQLD